MVKEEKTNKQVGKKNAGGSRGSVAGKEHGTPSLGKGKYCHLWWGGGRAWKNGGTVKLKKNDIQKALKKGEMRSNPEGGGQRKRGQGV